MPRTVFTIVFAGETTETAEPILSSADPDVVRAVVNALAQKVPTAEILHETPRQPRRAHA